MSEKLLDPLEMLLDAARFIENEKPAWAKSARAAVAQARRPTPSASAGAQELRSMADLVPIPQEEASALAGHLKGFASAGAVSELADRIDEAEYLKCVRIVTDMDSTTEQEEILQAEDCAEIAAALRLASGMPSRETMLAALDPLMGPNLARKAIDALLSLSPAAVTSPDGGSEG